MKRSTEGFVGVDPAAAKRAIVDYCSKRGALAVGVADLEALERIAPPAHRSYATRQIGHLAWRGRADSRRLATPGESHGLLRLDRSARLFGRLCLRLFYRAEVRRAFGICAARHGP